MKQPSYSRLKFSDRLIIEKMKRDNHTLREIAKEVGVTPSTISQELKKGDALGNGNYNAEYAEKQTQLKRANCKMQPTLSMNRELSARIAELILQEGQSPEQARITLQAENPASKIASINTIYRAIDSGLIPGVTRDSLLSKKTKMFSNGYICIPKWVRDEFHFCNGDIFSIEISADGTILLKKQAK